LQIPTWQNLTFLPGILETQEITLLQRWLTAQNFQNLLPQLCQNLPDESSKPLLDFLTPSKMDGQFAQAENLNMIDLSKLNYKPEKLHTLDLKAHKDLVHSFKQKFSCKANLSTSIYKSLGKKKPTTLIPRLVHQHKSIKFGYSTYSTFNHHIGNSTIFYQISDSKGRSQNVFGQISEIYTASYSINNNAPNQIHLWFEVKRFSNLSASDQKKHEFKEWLYARIYIMYHSKKKKDYIQIDDIIGHGATWKLPERCFGISNGLLAVDLSKKTANPKKLA
jgi:predicted amidophosphoribosyltransferase